MTYDKFMIKMQNLFEADYYERDDTKETFFDVVELGNNENEKARLFRKMQEVAQKRGLELTVSDGLKDPLTGTTHVDKNNEDPVRAIFKYLDMDALVEIPRRKLTVDDIVKASKNSNIPMQDPDETKDYTIVVTVSPEHPAEDDSVLKLFNTILTPLKTSVSNAGHEQNKNMYVYKFKAFSPKDVKRDDMTQLLTQNKGLMQDVGIKTVDIIEA